MANNVYSTRSWRIVRRRVLRRDGYRCRAVEVYDDVEIRCPCTAGLEVHHKVRPEDGGAVYDEANLLTLCPAHHGRLERRLDVERGRLPGGRRRKRARPQAAAYLDREQREQRDRELDERLARLVA